MNSLRLLGMAFTVLAATACTKPQPADTAAASGGETAAGASAATAEPAAATPVTLYNAYTSSVLTPEGVAGEPGKEFKAEDKIYAGVVLHGKSAASNIKVEWSTQDNTAPASGETSIAVNDASVATVELTKNGPLVPGSYKVLVYLDGAPGWELQFTVSE